MAGQQVCTGAPGAPPSSPVIQSADVPFTSMMHETPSLVNLTGKIMQDVATCLDGHSLLALLSTCCDLHDSPALRACMVDAVLQQLGAQEAALQDILKALPEAEALLDCASQVHQALQALQPGHFTGVALGRVRHETIAQQAADIQQSAVEALQHARTAVIAAQAAGQPGQQAQAAWRELGDIVVQARQGALQALSLEPPGEPVGQEGHDVGAAVQQALLALQQASHPTPEGHLGTRVALQTMQQAMQLMHQPELWQSKQQAMETVQSFIQTIQEVPEAKPRLQGASQAWQMVSMAQQRQWQCVQESLQAQQQDLLAMEHQLLLAAAGGHGMGAAVEAIQAASQELTAVREAMGRLMRVQLRQKQQVQRVMLQAAGRHLLAGQPQVDKAGQWLTAQVQARARDLKQDAQVVLQECVKAGVGMLQQADGNVPLGVLRVAVQAGQSMLQGLER